MRNKKTQGYTLIETLVAVSIFVIIVIFSVSSLLNAHSVGYKGRDLRNIIDNFNFAIEDMSRNIREGSSYRCYDAGGWSSADIQAGILETAQSCASGEAVFFENVDGLPQDSTDQWGYLLLDTGASTACDVTTVGQKKYKYNLCKTTDGGKTWVQLNPPEIQFTSNNMFSVLGAESPLAGFPDKYQQPLVRIIMYAEISYKSTKTNLSLQTTVSQRILDI